MIEEHYIKINYILFRKKIDRKKKVITLEKRPNNEERGDVERYFTINFFKNRHTNYEVIVLGND